MKTFIVLGMHRSATSLIAKGLCEAGVNMGERLLGAHESNPYGHFEDIDFIYLNDKILANAGGSWDCPPREEYINEISDKFAEEIKEFIRSKEKPPLWGWKDPRTTLTIRCYINHLENPHIIACYRKPEQVARSLLNRDNMPIERGIELAGIYNHRMAEFLQEFYS